MIWRIFGTDETSAPAKGPKTKEDIFIWESEEQVATDNTETKSAGPKENEKTRTDKNKINEKPKTGIKKPILKEKL